MIPSDLLNLGRLRPATDAGPQQVTPTQAVSDLLAELAPGQRVLAEIQAALPNGTYRALIAQREVTLALPFAAKSGDALEMEVVENNGRTALAVMSGHAPTEEATAGSVSTSLSRTGQLIATLLSDTPGSQARATPLNGNRPLLFNPEGAPEQAAPILKQAITSSGLFYEAHQARWTMGQFDITDLLKEPQAQALPINASLIAQEPPASAPSLLHPSAQSSATPLPPTHPRADIEAAATQPRETVTGAAPPPQNTSNTMSTASAADTLPLVRQQLESLASNTYVWNGQIWPGQNMQWEIVEEEGQKKQTNADEEPESTWNTRLRLDLPHLGAIDAKIGLKGDQITVNIAASDPGTQEELRNSSNDLAKQLESAGLNLGGFLVEKNAPIAT